MLNEVQKRMPGWVPSILWVVGIALTAYFLGGLISLYLKGKWTVPQEMIVRKKEVQVQAPQQSLPDFERNIIPLFGEGNPEKAASEKSKNEKKDEAPVDPEDPVNQVDWNQVIGAEGQIILKGTVIGSDTAFAFVNVGGKDLALQLGQSLGNYQVDRIMKGTITFKKGEQEKVVAMGLATGAGGVAHIPARQPMPAAKKADEDDELKDIVSKSGDKTVVDRRKFNALLKPPSRLAKSIKFIPNSKDGKPYGIRISYLKDKSFFTQVGMQPGDILVKSNKKEIKSVEDSFETYQMFKNEDHMTLEVDRGGQIIQLPIEFR